MNALCVKTYKHSPEIVIKKKNSAQENSDEESGHQGSEEMAQSKSEMKANAILSRINGKCKEAKPKQTKDRRKSSHKVVRRRDVPLKSSPSEEFKFSRKGFILSFTGNLEDFYNISEEALGKGTYGCVYTATDKILRTTKAVKTVSKKKLKNIPRFRQEIDIMKNIDHPNIVKLYETFEDDSKIYLVIEMCTGGELFDKIVEKGYFSEVYASFIMKQVFGVVNYLHLRNIAHRDLKPENFLFYDKSPDSLIKVIDFGLASYFTEEEPQMKTKAGTPYYVAPQVLTGKFDCKCDIWSAGVLFYILMCGYPPFYGDTDNEILKRVKSGVFDFKGKEWKHISSEAKDLISLCLTMDPAKRVSASDALKHPWFKLKTTKYNLEAKIDIHVLENLKSYGLLLKLQKLAITIIAQQSNDFDVHHLKASFIALDEEGKGYLTKEQLKKGLENNGLKVPNNLDALLDSIDSDGSGKIDYTEFIAASIDRKHFSKKLLYCAFRVFDVDNDGKITTAELAHILYNGNKNKRITHKDVEKVKKMIKEVDKNNDGTIDFHEFVDMMKLRT